MNIIKACCLYTVNLGYSGLCYNGFLLKRIVVPFPGRFYTLFHSNYLGYTGLYISHLRSHRISRTFPSSWFFSAIPFLAKQLQFHNFYSVFERSDMKTANVIWYHSVPGDAVETCEFCTFYAFATDKVKPLAGIMDKAGQPLPVCYSCSREKVL